MSTWTLTDVDHDLWVETVDLGAEALDLPADSGVRITKRRLRGGVRDGVDLLCVDNGAFALTLLPTRGMGLWAGHFRGLRIGWRSPVRGPVHPAFVRAGERGGLGWLNGFDECLCRCGLASNGAPGPDERPGPGGAVQKLDLTLHGRIANQPASRVAVSVDPASGALAVEGVVEEGGMYDDRLRLTTRYTTVVGSNTWTITDEVANVGGTATESQLLYHCNFGLPLLGAGACISLPARQIVPRDLVTVADPDPWDRYSGPTPGRPECCYFIEPLPDARGWVPALLRNAEGRFGIEVAFDARQLPCFSLWKHCAAAADGYATGLEPATNYPNPRRFERRQGRVRTLAPGESYGATLTLSAWDTAQAVAATEQRIAEQQGEIRPVVHSAPLPDVCP